MSYEHIICECGNREWRAQINKKSKEIFLVCSNKECRKSKLITFYAGLSIE